MLPFIIFYCYYDKILDESDCVMRVYTIYCQMQKYSSIIICNNGNHVTVNQKGIMMLLF